MILQEDMHKSVNWNSWHQNPTWRHNLNQQQEWHWNSHQLLKLFLVWPLFHAASSSRTCKMQVKPKETEGKDWQRGNPAKRSHETNIQGKMRHISLGFLFPWRSSSSSRSCITIVSFSMKQSTLLLPFHSPDFLISFSLFCIGSLSSLLFFLTSCESPTAGPFLHHLLSRSWKSLKVGLVSALLVSILFR